MFELLEDSSRDVAALRALDGRNDQTASSQLSRIATSRRQRMKGRQVRMLETQQRLKCWCQVQRDLCSRLCR